ncbi:hypothetical protein [Anaerovibrio lipolyticus]|uniref:hypothetical protein n=1 Tax=Anaerovibrio lipolyticus TaxID=82374 RepID=UPI0012DD3FF6|nr:hypothetical protein [Anaerovibrio lipolyticus]
MNVKKILVVVVIGFIIGAAVVLCLRSNVPDNGVGVDTFREQLDGAIRLERQTIRDVESAADTAAGVRGEIESGRAGVREATKSNLQLKEGNDRAGELIRDCQSILKTVRERGASKTE